MHTTHTHTPISSGCSSEEDCLVYSEIPASLSVHRTDMYGAPAPHSKFFSGAVPTFGEPKVSVGCLESMMLLKDQVMTFLQKTNLRHVVVLLSKDEATADILRGCLHELNIVKPVWSTDQLIAMKETHLHDILEELFGAEEERSFLRDFEKHIKQLQWKGTGELPLDVDEFVRKDGLHPTDMLPVGSLNKNLNLLLMHKTGGSSCLYEKLALQMRLLHDVAEDFFGSQNRCTPVTFCDLNGQTFSDDITVGWLCVHVVCRKTAILVSQKSSSAVASKSWIDLLEEELHNATVWMRSRMPWKCLPDLSSMAVCQWHVSKCRENGALHPPVWIDILCELDYDLNPAKALDELRLVDERIWCLMKEASRRYGYTVAVGVVNSLALNYKAAVRERGHRATPAALDLFFISPRLEDLDGLCSTMEILFKNKHDGGGVDKGRAPLKIKHVTTFAQVCRRKPLIIKIEPRFMLFMYSSSKQCISCIFSA